MDFFLPVLALAGMVVVLFRPQYWFAVVHAGVLLLMWQGHSVASMAAYKLVVLAAICYRVVLRGRPIRWDLVDTGWAIVVVAQLFGLGMGLYYGRGLGVIAVSVWLFLQAPVYWWIAQASLDQSALDRNFLILALLSAAMFPMLWFMGGRATVGTSVIGGYLSHLLIPWCFDRVNLTKGTVRLVMGLLATVLVLDLLLGAGRRYWIPAAFALIGYTLTSSTRRRLKIVLSAAFAIILVVLLRYDLLLWAITKDDGWRSDETEGILAGINGVRWLIGEGYGFRYELELPWGVELMGPGAHNFYAAILLNTGLFGILTFMLAVVLVFVAARPRNPLAWSYVWMFGGWVIAAWFDKPTDGLWVFGMIPAAAWIFSQPAKDNAWRRPHVSATDVVTDVSRGVSVPIKNQGGRGSG